MDRLLIIEPKELVLKFDIGEASSGTVRLKNVMHTMPVAYQVQPMAAKRYSINPPYGIIRPLGDITVEIVLNPPTELPETVPLSQDKFLVKSVVVPGGSQHETVSLDWFSAKRKQVFADHGLKVFFVGPGILTKLVTKGDMEDIRDALERDEEIINELDSQGKAALHVAISTGRPELVQLLLEFSADLEIRNKAGRTALHEAAAAGEALMVELLLANGARTKAKSSTGWTALHYAVTAGHLEVVRLLLDMGTKTDDATKDGRTAIHMAVAEGHKECLRILLEKGGNVDLRGSDGETALHIAASTGNVDMVQLLLDSGAKKDIRDREGKTPIRLATKIGRNELLDMLGLGDDLRYGARKGQLKLVQRSLMKGAMLNGQDEQGWTALHRAAFKGNTDVIKYLLEKGADIESKDEEGYTPLHCATEASQENAILLLLKHGANTNARSKKGATPFQIAKALKHHNITPLLIPADANHDKHTPDGSSQPSHKLLPAEHHRPRKNTTTHVPDIPTGMPKTSSSPHRHLPQKSHLLPPPPSLQRKQSHLGKAEAAAPLETTLPLPPQRQRSASQHHHRRTASRAHSREMDSLRLIMA
eukprot:c6342_g1_i1 orf=390-2159(+)